MKVLVVDQEIFLAELVKLALEADGHACFTAAGTAEASGILSSVRIDLLTIDLDEHEGDTLDWLEDVVLAYPGLHGHVYVLSGRLLDQAEVSRLQACGARVVRKPFTLHQLRETVRMMTPAEGRASDPRPRGTVLET
jgi:DNA-binding response OmpR family regulator